MLSETTEAEESARKCDNEDKLTQNELLVCVTRMEENLKGLRRRLGRLEEGLRDVRSRALRSGERVDRLEASVAQLQASEETKITEEDRVRKESLREEQKQALEIDRSPLGLNS